MLEHVPPSDAREALERLRDAGIEALALFDRGDHDDVMLRVARASVAVSDVRAMCGVARRRTLGS